MRPGEVHPSVGSIEQELANSSSSRLGHGAPAEVALIEATVDESLASANSLEAAALDFRSGQLRVLRSDGAWDDAPTGELSVALRSIGAKSTERVLRIHEGRFDLGQLADEDGDGVASAWVKPIAFMDADQLRPAVVLDGLDWANIDAAPFEGVPTSTLSWSAAEAQPLRLTAIDGLSGLNLSRLQVELLAADRWLATPADPKLVPVLERTSGATPLILDPLPFLGDRGAECALSVSADGYAPLVVAVDRRSPADLELVLWPEATLTVRTRDELRPAAWLELERLDGLGGITRHGFGSAARTLKGLMPGSYRVTWVNPAGTGAESALDSRAVRLAAGEKREVWLDAPDLEPLHAAMEHAELWLPELWWSLAASDRDESGQHLLVLSSPRDHAGSSGGFGGDVGFAGFSPSQMKFGRETALRRPVLRGLLQMGSDEHDGEAGRLFQFSTTELPAGRYVATVLPEGVSLWIDLPDTVGETPRFTAPEPVAWELNTHRLNEISGHEPPGPLAWRMRLPGGGEDLGLMREVLPSEDGAYRFLAPEGELELELVGLGWAIEPDQSRVSEPNALLDIVPLTPFGLFLGWNDQAFPWSEGCELQLVSESGDVPAFAFEGHALLSRLGVGSNGAFRIVVRTEQGASWMSMPLYFGSVGHEKVVKLEKQ